MGQLLSPSAALDKPKPPPVPVQRQLDEQQVTKELLSGQFDGSELETGEELLYLRPGVQRTVFRKLRRGQFTVEAELDLHGMNVDKASRRLAEFLTESQSRDSVRLRGDAKRLPCALSTKQRP